MFCGMCLGDTTFIGILAILPPALAFAAGFRTYVRAKQIEQELAPARQVQLDLFPDENALTTPLKVLSDCV